MLIDTHAHLNFKAFNKDLPQVIERATKTSVMKIIIPGAKIDSSRKAVEIAHKYPSCFAAVGIHPHHAPDYEILLAERNKRGILKKEFASFTKQKKVVAVGEVGLDYHQYQGYPPISASGKYVQKQLFLLQLSLALEANLPLIFHCRQAYDDLIFTIMSFLKNPKKKVMGVFHCFAGTKKHLASILDLGFYIGFDGNITYPENKHLHNLVKSTPIERILLETDSPFLAPVPFRGKRSQPSYLPHIAAAVASILKKKLTLIQEITSGNASKLFNL